jgi:hypothetical protein
MRQSTYRLTAGFASIKFNDGANVTIEAPAKWSLQSSGNMELFSGHLYAIVPQQARGFSVTAGNTKIIDRGTEFGIEMDKHKATQLHVTRGRTLLFYGSKDGRKFEKEVDKGSARHVNSNGKLTIIPLASKKFARNIDSSSGQITRTSGFISYPQITNDADCGIDSSNTYTHAIDFGIRGTTTINGVVFANDINEAAGGRSNAGSITYGTETVIVTDPTVLQYGGLGTDLNKLLNDFLWGGPDEGFIELTGLTPGQWYDLRLYDHAYPYDAPARTYHAVYDVGSDRSVEFTTPKIDQNVSSLTPPGLSGDVAWAVSYVYQADTTGKIKVTIDLANDAFGTYHLYGITNAETDPPDANTPTVNAGDDTSTIIDSVQSINHKESK